MDFILRPWRKSDAESMARYANDPLIAKNLRDAFPHPYTVEDARQFIQDCLELDGKECYARAIEVNGEAVGSVTLFFKTDVYCKNAEIRYWLGQPFWRDGIISRAIEQICDEVVEKYDIVRIYAKSFAQNIGSRRALEKAGFQLEGTLQKSIYKNGFFFDSCIYAKLRQYIVKIQRKQRFPWIFFIDAIMQDDNSR